MSEAVAPNRTDVLLGVIHATPAEELTPVGLFYTMQAFEPFKSFTRRAIIESLAHLETNDRVAFDPKLHITERGKQRLRDIGMLEDYQY